MSINGGVLIKIAEMSNSFIHKHDFSNPQPGAPGTSSPDGANALNEVFKNISSMRPIIQNAKYGIGNDSDNLKTLTYRRKPEFDESVMEAMKQHQPNSPTFKWLQDTFKAMQAEKDDSDYYMKTGIYMRNPGTGKSGLGGFEQHSNSPTRNWFPNAVTYTSPQNGNSMQPGSYWRNSSTNNEATRRYFNPNEATRRYFNPNTPNRSSSPSLLDNPALSWIPKTPTTENNPKFDWIHDTTDVRGGMARPYRGPQLSPSLKRSISGLSKS